MKISSVRTVLLALLAVGLLLLSACGGSYEFKGGVVNPPQTAPDFTLTDQHGKPFRLSEQQGKLTLVFFGFTTCPDVCPTTLSDIKAAQRELGSDADKVQVVMVTLDPERDTPERLNTYMSRFDPSYLGLTGSPETLEKVYKDYGVTVIKRDLPESALKYTFDHSTFTYVVDQKGAWPLAFVLGMKPADIASDLRYLIRNGGFPAPSSA
ncbi:MAG TPA: SCO family protein [Roseiflexaceae bacterium]|nr:SCO family protein [Roseiflexaceae bacterium]